MQRPNTGSSSPEGVLQHEGILGYTITPIERPLPFVHHATAAESSSKDLVKVPTEPTEIGRKLAGPTASPFLPIETVLVRPNSRGTRPRSSSKLSTRVVIASGALPHLRGVSLSGPGAEEVFTLHPKASVSTKWLTVAG